MITANPALAYEDAVALLYCFNALESMDFSLFEIPNSLETLSNHVIKTLDKLFLIKFEKDPVYAELDNFLSRIFLWQRIKLFSPCLGKPANDGGFYGWYYTEWNFLYGMKCKYNEKYAYLSDYENNTGYNTHYAVDKLNHNIFGEELLALAPHINLAFQGNVDWHTKIEFTPECSNYIFNMRLHVDSEHIRLMLKAKHTHSFFQQTCRSGTLKENLPEEIIRIIFTFAGPFFSLEELGQVENSRMLLSR